MLEWGFNMRQFFIKFTIIALAGLIFIYALISDGLKNSRGSGYHFSNRVAVLEYHNIDPVSSDYTITPEAFKAQLLALKNNHYNVIPMSQFIAFLGGKQTVPPDSVVITFDDGYESFYRYAYPMLKEQNLTATNFIIVSYLETNPGIPFLTWKEIEEMKGSGFSFYSHTYNNHDFVAEPNGKLVDPLTNPIYDINKQRVETAAEYAARIKDDLSQADQIIQSKLGAQDKLFCFPHGRYNKTVLSAGDELGIQYYFTGIDGLNARGAKLIKRINAGAAKVTPAKLLQKLDDETNVLGKVKITLKNYIQGQRMSE
jgi:biofilm PGA synthesis lipoprotein PgaB